MCIRDRLTAINSNALLTGHFADVVDRRLHWDANATEGIAPNNVDTTLANPPAGRWVDSISDTPFWGPDTDHEVGDIVQQPRLSDGTLVLLSWSDAVNNDGVATAGTSGATFDANESDRWDEIGAASLNLEILQSIEVTVRGHQTSSTVANNLILKDLAGATISDWEIIDDTQNALSGPLGTKSINPPVNSTRTITLRHTGNATVRGLSSLTANFRTDATSTGFSQVKVKFFSGTEVIRTRNGPTLGTYEWDFENIDFLTDPQTETESTAIPRRTYSASGPISDEDQKAVFYSDENVVAMTVESAVDRRIVLIRSGSENVVITDAGGKMFRQEDPNNPAEVLLDETSITLNTNST